jgi:hypothetical protein
MIAITGLPMAVSGNTDKSVKTNIVRIVISYSWLDAGYSQIHSPVVFSQKSGGPRSSHRANMPASLNK